VTSRASVLVVDDDAINRMVLQRSLEQEGHAVRVAPDGRAALELLRSDPFDIALLDVLMPEWTASSCSSCYRPTSASARSP
jgi:CheY-like chemotaxis protein